MQFFPGKEDFRRVPVTVNHLHKFQITADHAAPAFQGVNSCSFAVYAKRHIRLFLNAAFGLFQSSLVSLQSRLAILKVGLNVFSPDMFDVSRCHVKRERQLTRIVFLFA